MDDKTIKQKSNTWLLDIYLSKQSYEAVIVEILNMLPRRDRWCVEFGAWDGCVASNSRELILHHGYSAILIEGDKDRFRDLQRNYSDRSEVVTLNQFVGFSTEDGLDVILAKTPVPLDFDFLSIDIDGNDYHVWNVVTKYHPKVVCVEFNPTIPAEVSFVQPMDPAVNQGCGLSVLVELGRRKGYELVSVIDVNAFFVSRDYFPIFGIADNRIEALWVTRDDITFIFSGYDGRIFLRGNQTLPWHKIPLVESKMQVLPAFLRKCPYTRKRRIIYTCLTDPFSLVPKVLGRIANLNPFRKKS